jgi:hypothetical protein
MFQHTIFVCWYLLVIFFWPYFIPEVVKISLILLSIIFVIFYVYLLKATQYKDISAQDVFYLSELGQIEWVKSSEVGQLLSSSYFWSFCFYLRIHNPITQENYWKVIFTDQLDNESVRRLRRIIKTIKRQ